MPTDGLGGFDALPRKTAEDWRRHLTDEQIAAFCQRWGVPWWAPERFQSKRWPTWIDIAASFGETVKIEGV